MRRVYVVLHFVNTPPHPRTPAMLQLILPTLCAAASLLPDAGSAAPKIDETRTYKIRQTVSLNDVPATAKEVKLWVPVPADGDWQHVVDRRVIEAPAGWKLVHQPECDSDMI